ERERVSGRGGGMFGGVVDRVGQLSGFATERIGYGAGTKQFPQFPNCLRLMLGEERSISSERARGDVIVIEANIDDMNPQNFAYVNEKLQQAGALDVFTVPVQMKKGRTGQLLQVLAPSDAVDALSKVIFQETTTIGVRKYPVDRTTLDREFVEVETEYGRVKIKVSKLGGEVVNFAPEYEDCVRIA